MAGGHRGGAGKLSLSISSSGTLTEDMLTEDFTMAASPPLDNETSVSNATHVHAVDHNPEWVWQRSDAFSTDVLPTSVLNLSHGQPRRVGELHFQRGEDFFVLKSLQSVWTCTFRALASGAFGSVHVGEDNMGLPVVVKFIIKFDQKCSNDPFEEFSKQQEVKSEYVAVPCEVFELQKSQLREFPSGTCCIVMEKLHADLAETIRLDAESEPHAIIGNADAVKKIWSMALVAVMKVHDQGMIFRDIKPQNILVTTGSVSDMIAKLTDFGIAVYHYEKINSTSVVRNPHYVSPVLLHKCGTPNYVSPELLHDRPYGAANDAWALGVLLYFLYYGKTPFVGRNKDVLFQNIKSHKSGQLSFPEPLPPPQMKELIENLLQPDPARRRCIRKFDSPTEHLSKELISHHEWVKYTVDELMQGKVDHPMHEDKGFIAPNTLPQALEGQVKEVAEAALSTPLKDLSEHDELEDEHTGYGLA